jgi:hypothetical protein
VVAAEDDLREAAYEAKDLTMYLYYEHFSTKAWKAAAELTGKVRKISSQFSRNVAPRAGGRPWDYWAH